MKLHRLVLTNYRGITHREIDFPDHGVIVVCGANEVGKSSMIEALDLLLESKDRSTKKDVKQVKPTHADVGSEVTAEISTGPYRFIYRKRFHKKCETQLTVLSPRREQLTGDEAHDRVRAMLAETVDIDLWHAQRVLQAASTCAVDLSGCDALSRALDVAAGDAAALSGTEPLLIEKIDAEYGRYFTPTGRPTGEWAGAISALSSAEQEVARCAAAVAEVDDRVHMHAELTERLAGLAGQQESVTARHAAAEAAAEAVAELTAELRRAELVATAARATGTASTAAHAERLRLCTEVDARAATVTEVAAVSAEAAEAESTAREVAELAAVAADEAAVAVAAAQARVDASRRVVEQLTERDEADRLTARLARIDSAQSLLAQAEAELAKVVLTETALREIESAAAAVGHAETQLALTSATVEFTAAADLELLVGEDRVALSAGQSWSVPATSATAVQLPGVLSVRVIPGATAIDIEAKLAAAQRVLADALTATGVPDIDAARRIDEQRRALLSTRDQQRATLLGLRGDDDVEQLRARLAALRAAQPTEAGLWDLTADAAAARTDLAQACTALTQAGADHETARRVAAAAVQQLGERATRATVLREKVGAARTELDSVRDRLTRQRAVAVDDDLAIRAEADARAIRQAAAAVEALSEQLAQAAPDAVCAELAQARNAAAALRREHDELARALHQVSVELAVFGTEGRKGMLDAAQTAREHAAAQYSRVRRRARAAELLRSVMARHRDNTRLRYVDPFRAEIERLGRPVFGPSFEVEVDSDLRICNRTLDGRTVPYESLSGGAKEQLGILARLAGAALVAKEDSVPVVIDDALGFTDPDRLTKMGAVFDAVGSVGQVIVLTCTPTRYLGVKDAHVIELSA
jgi:hypothetical protein